MPRKQIDLYRLPRRQQYLIGVILVVIVATVAWIVGKDEPIPPWITEWLLPTLAWLGLALIVLAVADWLCGRRSSRRPPEE